MGTTTSQSKLLLNEICVSVVIVGRERIELPTMSVNWFTVSRLANRHPSQLKSNSMISWLSKSYELVTVSYCVGKLSYALNPLVFQTNASTKLASTPLCSHSRTRTYTPLINSQVHFSILLCENICFHMRTWTPIYKFVACRSIRWTMWKNCTLRSNRNLFLSFGD